MTSERPRPPWVPDAGVASRVAVVTGGTGGIGAACVETLARHGAHVVAWDIRPTADHRFIDRLVDEGLHVQSHVVDVTDPGAVRRASEGLESQFGGVDILINTAARLGLERETPFWELEDEQFAQVISGCFLAMVVPTRVLVPAMIRRRQGRVVSLSSAAAHVGSRSAMYAASKGAVEALSRSLATTLGHYGITVNCVAPALVRTPHTEPLIRGREDELRRRYPAEKLGQPDDVSRAVLFLASDAAGWITGQTVHVNGGLSM